VQETVRVIHHILITYEKYSIGYNDAVVDCADLTGDGADSETEAELTTRRAVADWSSSTGTDRHVISSGLN